MLAAEVGASNRRAVLQSHQGVAKSKRMQVLVRVVQ